METDITDGDLQGKHFIKSRSNVIMTGNEVRSKFLGYFKKQGHQIVRSSSLVPADDPTLLFVNAGMVQFKRCFLGEENRGYTRATTAQKCVRAGGKHNDLENVGFTARHHTFFEMLGNFSFGDYFKEKAVDFGWDLLTNGYGLPADKLWVSVYLDDDEAAQIWHRRAGVPTERIARFGEKDNFWAMGDTGPCGPCSEIHLDRGAEYGCGRPDCALGCECDRFLELWNLVFMQYDRDAAGTLTPLPKPSIDTGAGLERLASVLQNKATNFETDLLFPIIEKAQDLSNVPFGRDERSDVAMKVIADHSRAAAFLIGDGILPSNEGRGYVLRRIMRRAIRFGRSIGLTKPFLHETAQTVFDIMAPAYPDLKQASAFITSVIKNEEERFIETLDHGLRLLGDTLADLKAKGENQVPGQVVFKLYDTYGFPVDIVRDVVKEEKMDLDLDGFNQAMEGQRARSRSTVSFAGIGEAFKELTAKGVKADFLGYASSTCTADIALLVAEGKAVESAGEGTQVEIVTDRTVFYGEAGGQVGDVGTLRGPGGCVEITNTVKDPTGLIIHHGRVVSGVVAAGDTVDLQVDEAKRRATACNHSATHILHFALRSVLGDHVKQAGSLVSPERLRFDFTHFSQVEPEDLVRIEALVNAKIRENAEVATEEMDAETAFKSGATALFEEKYGDRVRVVSMGPFSKELCGGTHTHRSGDIGLFKILSESSVAAGVRRIEAVTGAQALDVVQNQERLLTESARLVKVKPEELAARLESLIAENRQMAKTVDQLKAQQAAKAVDDIEGSLASVAGVRVLVKKVEVDSPAALRDLADKFRDKIGSGIVVLGAAAGEKALLIAVVTKDLATRFHAGNLIKAIAPLVGGGGGGRPDMAQAGGSQPEKLDAALAKAADVVAGQAG
jgi:alanyl-tRNA synthetase